MLLEGKNAVVYGGAGSVGRAVARAFAREGARVFLVGRTLATLDEVAQELSGAAGLVETAQVDALDERAVDEHAESSGQFLYACLVTKTTVFCATAAANTQLSNPCKHRTVPPDLQALALATAKDAFCRHLRH